MKGSFLLIYAIAVMAASAPCSVNAKDHSNSPVAGTEIKLSRVEKEKLDTFFSNFSEIPLDKFSEHRVKDESLLYFGIRHNWINNRTAFKIDGIYATISEKKVNDSIYKYFGIEVKPSAAIKAKFDYRDGKYRTPCADGETLRFSQLHRMFADGKDCYICFVNTYYASSGFTGNLHKPVAELNRGKDENDRVSADERIVAKIRKVTENGAVRYILLSYERRR